MGPAPPTKGATSRRSPSPAPSAAVVTGDSCPGRNSANSLLCIPAVSDLGLSLKPSREASRNVVPCKARSFTQCLLGGGSADQEVVIALGSNVGDRISAFDRALRLMKNSGINISRHAWLYETALAYVTGQPWFLNSAVRGTTKLGPHELLKELKEIEKDIGRTGGISFSDASKFQEVEAAILQTKLLISEGADIIDIGAQSTRSFAERLSAEEELERLVPILDAIMEIPEMEGKLLSVDTFYAEVATEAVKRGVHIVNDVSGGQIDPRILKVVAELGVSYVTMQMRGDPSTMQSEQNLLYGDVCKEVASELYTRVREAELSGIPSWRIVFDPGIGFSKKSKHNLELITGLESIRAEMVERDVATVTAGTAGILNGANIIRVHDVGYGLDTANVCDALSKGRG
ncbi:hypothetical protein GUJ93_ZPchr0007g4012 [Zizania palustris]|uniref:dihydropteroate synthase n=1 Tax=Zizania palustris TaxID=103762 RepID=A0A8J5TFH3_ZIZPA|nr:hypothetical protein GUJ93_ZPchr0007g4012 [Zizania palustris]